MARMKQAQRRPTRLTVDIIEAYNAECAEYAYGEDFNEHEEAYEQDDGTVIYKRYFNQLDRVRCAFGTSLRKFRTYKVFREEYHRRLRMYQRQGHCPEVKRLKRVNPGAEQQLEADYQVWLAKLNRDADEYERLERNSA